MEKKTKKRYYYGATVYLPSVGQGDVFFVFRFLSKKDLQGMDSHCRPLNASSALVIRAKKMATESIDPNMLWESGIPAGRIVVKK